MPAQMPKNCKSDLGPSQGENRILPGRWAVASRSGAHRGVCTQVSHRQKEFARFVLSLQVEKKEKRSNAGPSSTGLGNQTWQKRKLGPSRSDRDLEKKKVIRNYQDLSGGGKGCEKERK